MIKIKLGKTLIIGDSYSTFRGYIPEGYNFWYSAEKEEGTDVKKVEQTWWYKLFYESGNENILIRNDSNSGTTICNTVRPLYSVKSSFVSRLDKLISEEFFAENAIETVLVFGGTNDSWINSPIGECKFDGFKEEDLLYILPACGYLASKLAESAPNATVCWFINPGIKQEIAHGMIKNAEHFGQKYIEFKDIDKISGHPSVLGMNQIVEQIKAFFE